jgi:hypothetical protein
MPYVQIPKFENENYRGTSQGTDTKIYQIDFNVCNISKIQNLCICLTKLFTR